MANIDEGKARKQAKPQEYYDSYDRIFGWECLYCKIRTKEDKCPQCGRQKENH